MSYPLGRKYIAYINKAEPTPIEIYHKFSKEIPEEHAAIIGGLREQYYFENSTYQLTLTDKEELNRRSLKRGKLIYRLDIDSG